MLDDDAKAHDALQTHVTSPHIQSPGAALLPLQLSSDSLDDMITLANTIYFV